MSSLDTRTPATILGRSCAALYRHRFAIIGLFALSLLFHTRYLLPGGLSLSRTGDSLWEILPAKLFYQRSLLAGSPYWSWSYGLGGDILTEFSFFYSTSPFFYLETGLMRLFGADFSNITQALQWKLIFSICKLYLILLLTYRLLIVDGKKRLFAFMGAVCYGAGCRFLYYSINADFMTDAYVYLPLIMLSFRRYQREGKYLPLLLSIALCVANSFYFGFINCFYLGIVALVFYWDKKRGMGPYFKSLGRVVCIALAGIALSAVVFLPAVNGLISTARDAYGGGWALLPTAGDIDKLTTRLFSWDSLLALPVFLLPFCFVLPKGLPELTRRKAVIAAFYVLMIGVPAFWRLMGGLGYPTDRWQYVAAFALAYLLPDILEAYPFAGRRFYGLAEIAIAGCIFVLTMDRYDGVRSLTNLCWLLCAAAAAGAALVLFTRGIVKGERGRKLISCLLLLCVTGAGLLYSIALEVANIPYASAEGVLMGSEKQRAFAARYQPEKDRFYRIHDMSLDADSGRPEARSLLNGTYTISAYGSMIDGVLFDWMHKTHNVYSQLVEPNQYRSLDNRLFLETAWGVQYKLAEDETEQTPAAWTQERLPDGSAVYKNDYYVGFDLWYDRTLANDTYASLNYAEKDAALLQAACVEAGVAGELARAELDQVTDTAKIEPGAFDLSNGAFSDGVFIAGEGATLTLPLQSRAAAGEGEYLFSVHIVPVDGRTFTVGVNGRESNRMADGSNWVLHLNTFSFRIPSDAAAIEMTLTPGQYRISDCMLSYSSYEKLPAWVEARNRYEMTDLSVDGADVSGSISVDSAGILALSMPFNPGWTCRLNGERTELFRVNQVFTGMLLRPGSYDIQLRFTPPYLVLGALISVTAAGGIGAQVLLGYLQKKRRAKAACDSV